jgi:hypothetical protein
LAGDAIAAGGRLLSSHPTTAITVTTLFGAVPAATQQSVIQDWWWLITLSTAPRLYLDTTRFSRLAGKNSLIEASASG